MKKNLITFALIWVLSPSGFGHSDSHGPEGAKVGSDKGILEADEHTGLRLSPEALRNFEIQTVKLTGAGPWEVPAAVRVLSSEEVNVYRMREGFFKRIDFKVISAEKSRIKIASEDLRSGDEVVTSGAGFLRIAEIAAFGGESDEHGEEHE